MGYINEENVQIAMTEYGNLREGRIAWRPDGKKLGYVSKVYDNENGHGEQIYVIVPNKEDLAHPEQAEHITVLMRGSTGPMEYEPKGLLKDVTGLSLPTGLSPEQEAINADIRADWIENDLPMGFRIIDEKYNYGPSLFLSAVTSNPLHIGKALWNKDKSRPTPQLVEASNALQEILAEHYPNATFKLYGHSLGTMDGQNALANLTEEQLDRLEDAWFYNGPNIASQLDREQLKKLLPYKYKINFYIDPSDPVGLDFEKGTLSAIGMVHFVDSRPVGFVDQHMTYGYTLDADGNIKLISTVTTSPINNLLKRKASFNNLHGQWSVGGISSSEELYLDVAQSYVIGQSMADAAKVGLDEMTALKTKADAEVKELMTKARSHFSIYSELSPWEVQDIFASCGVSDQMVTDFQTYTEGKVKSMSDLSSQFDGLKSSIDTLIETTVATDSKLGGEFQAWQES